MIAAPMFHSWGFVHFTLGMGLGSTLVLRRKFDPEDTLSATAQHECTALVVVPVMLQRIMELPAETIDRYDLGALRVIAASGSALPGELAVQGHGPLRRRALQPLRLDRGGVGDDRHPRGPARRAGHRRAPAARHGGQAPRRGGQRGRPTGQTGRIFVGNEMAFEGYTGGGEQGEHRRPAVLRRRRALRLGRAPVHRRPRRRDDRLGRRERVPARGRGPARTSTRPSTRWPSSASRTSSSASA